jgi:cytochrome c-type biogenesis protein CcmH/NrfG
MSLLMKALEKAAKDRGEARAEPAAANATAPAAATAAAASPRGELTLEPLTSEPPAAGAPPGSGVAARPAAGASAREQARAASVLQASKVSGEMAVRARARPVLLIGGIAALVAIGFGTYVYLQVFHPSLFYGQPVAKPAGAPLAQGPAPAPAPAPAAPAPQPADIAAAAPLPSAPLLEQPALEPPQPPAPPPAPAVAAPARPRAPEAVAAPTPKAAPRDPIVVGRGTAAPAVSPLLTEAYGAFQSGRLEPAQGAYEQLLRAEPRNLDALLGLAAIAALAGRNEDAITRYLQVLELEPRHALAQSGLIGLLGRADPLAAEARLKHLIAREPSAFLYFTLGNLYADQSQWAGAQQAWFQAHHLEPRNPDYVYNLAVGLEHVSQPRLALGFYRRAVQLAAAAPAQFNLAQAQERIGKLASQVE